MDEYLTTRPNLRCIFVVIDSRHGPKKSDREMLSYLSKYGKVPVHVVLNKTDMVRTEELCKRMFLLERELKFIKRSSNVLKLVSASTGAGCTALFSEAFRYALPDADVSRRNKREKEAALQQAMELEELEQEGDVNNSGVGGKKYNKKARQKEQKFVMGGEWIPGEGPAVPISKDKKKDPIDVSGLDDEYNTMGLWSRGDVSGPAPAARPRTDRRWPAASPSARRRRRSACA